MFQIVNIRVESKASSVTLDQDYNKAQYREMQFQWVRLPTPHTLLLVLGRVTLASHFNQVYRAVKSSMLVLPSISTYCHTVWFFSMLPWKWLLWYKWDGNNLFSTINFIHSNGIVLKGSLTVPTCSIYWVVSHEIAEEQAAVISWLKWAEGPASKIIPIISDRPQLLMGCWHPSVPLPWAPPQDSSQHGSRLPPEQGIQRRERDRKYAKGGKLSSTSQKYEDQRICGDIFKTTTSWCSGWESACYCRGHGFEPWSGRIPHAAEQLGPWATTTEPARLEPVLCNKRGHDSERPEHRDEEWPPLATTRESPSTEMKTQHSNQSINQSINKS